MLKKIVFISIFRAGYGGGEGRVAHEIAHKFASKYEVALICPGDSTGLYHDEDDLKIFSIKSGGKGHITMPLLNQETIHQLFNFLDRFQPDIIHAHDPALLGVIAQVWAKMHQVPFIYTSHVLPWKALDFGASSAIRIPGGFLVQSMTEDLLKNFYENCDGVIALNELVANGIRDFGYTGRIFTIPNGRDLEKYQDLKLANLTGKEKCLIFIGFINSRKNQLYLLEALTYLPENYRLTLVGEPMETAYVQHINRFIRDQHLQNVHLTGGVSYEQIPCYLEKSHVLVSASKMEVQSLVVIEAMAAGRPVVGLSNETIDELVDESVGCRLPKDASPAEFAGCIEHICSLNQQEYEHLGLEARRRVSQLDWSNVIQLTLAAYTTLLSEVPTIPVIDLARLNRLIALIPAGQVRHNLSKRLASLSTSVKKVRNVSSHTWLVTGVTIVGSLIGYFTLRHLFPGQFLRGKLSIPRLLKSH